MNNRYEVDGYMIRELRADEFIALADLFEHAGESQKEQISLMGELCAYSICDDEGQRRFESAKDAMQALTIRQLFAIGTKAIEINDLGEKGTPGN